MPEEGERMELLMPKTDMGPKKERSEEKNVQEDLQCQHCGKITPDVVNRPDLYARDVNDIDGAMHVSCDDCHQERLDDI